MLFCRPKELPQPCWARDASPRYSCLSRMRKAAARWRALSMSIIFSLYFDFDVDLSLFRRQNYQ